MSLEMVENQNVKQQQLIPFGSPSHQVLMPLCYFEIFSYPLTLEEVLNFNHNSTATTPIIKKALDQLIKEGCIYQYDNFYLTQDRPDWIQLRKENNNRATHFIKRAKWMIRLISRFPYVRAVFLSGSLSKNVMQEDGDIDYFIITKPGRLWIACTLLILFKKIFLLNSHKYFCVNYFIDEEHLEMEEKNRFTATEIVTLLPINNSLLYEQFYEVNSWAKNYFPHHPKRLTQQTTSKSRGLGKRFIEFILDFKIFDRLDIYFMNKTVQFWNNKYQKFSSNKFATALKSKRYVSKRHPDDFQDKVKIAYETNIQNFEAKNNLYLERHKDWKID